MKKLFTFAIWKLCVSISMALALQVVLLHVIQTSSAKAELSPEAPAAGPCVNPGGTDGCYSSIQSAINAASSGDIVTVDTGTYAEHITMHSGVSVYGKGWSNTIIDGGYTSLTPVVQFLGL